MRLIALAALAGLLTTAAAADQRTNSYNLAPGTCSVPLAMPAGNKPIFMMGSQITPQWEGSGHVSIVRTKVLLSWAGIDYFAGDERGYALSSWIGTHIMWLDFAGTVDVQTAGSLRVKVCNAAASPLRAVGYLTFMW